MAKLTPGPLDPRAYPKTLKGFYLRQGRRGIEVAKSPSYGKPTNPASIWNRQQFAIAARMAASPIWLDYVGALAASKGTEQVPRDILMMAIFGSLYELVLPDGTKTTQADHSYRPPPQPKGATRMFDASMWDNAYNSSNSSKGGSSKGSTVEATRDMVVKGVSFATRITANSDMLVTIARLDAARKVTDIIATATFLNCPASGKRYDVPFTLPLQAGQQFTVLMTRTDSNTAYVFPLTQVSPGRWLNGFRTVETVRLGTLSPAVGDTYLLNDAEFSASLGIEYEVA